MDYFNIHGWNGDNIGFFRQSTKTILIGETGKKLTPRGLLYDLPDQQEIITKSIEVS